MNAPVVEGRFRGERVALVWGGLSNERQVSDWTAQAVEKALVERGYEVVKIDAGRDLAQRLAEVQPAVVFLALHGTYGEDGRIQGLLDWMGLPYTGDGLLASALAMDKGIAKRLMRDAGVSVLPDVVWRKDRPQSDRPTVGALPFDLPVVVKPIADGSSVGVSFAQTEAEFEKALDDCEAHPAVLVEPLVQGTELSVACLGNRALGVVEIAPERVFYDYTAKYLGGGTAYHLPPRVSEEAAQQATALGFEAHSALGCSGLTRTDIILTAEGMVVLEVNTLPGMTPSSLVPKIANAIGLSFPDLIEVLLDRAQYARELQAPGGAS
ncbi:MAG: D-alanine--D-alanine ligase [Bradymonadia bacterium]